MLGMKNPFVNQKDMKAAAFSFANGQLNRSNNSDVLDDHKAQLVLGFGAKSVLAGNQVYGLLYKQFPYADIVLCSTSGEIFNSEVFDHTVSVTALQFDQTRVSAAKVNVME